MKHTLRINFIVEKKIQSNHNAFFWFTFFFFNEELDFVDRRRSVSDLKLVNIFTVHISLDAHTCFDLVSYSLNVAMRKMKIFPITVARFFSSLLFSFFRWIYNLWRDFFRYIFFFLEN